MITGGKPGENSSWPEGEKSLVADAKRTWPFNLVLSKSGMVDGTLPLKHNSITLKNGSWETTFLYGRLFFWGELLVLGRVKSLLFSL